MESSWTGKFTIKNLPAEWREDIKAGKQVQMRGKQYLQYIESIEDADQVETAVAEINFGYAAEGTSTGDAIWEIDEVDPIIEAGEFPFAESRLAMLTAIALMLNL